MLFRRGLLMLSARRNLGLPVILHCPICGGDFDSATLVVEPGLRGAVRCPSCKGRVLISSPYGRQVAITSLLVAWAILAAMHVRTILGFVIGTLLLWAPACLVLNSVSVRIKPAGLKERKARQPRTRKTLFERLYERTRLRTCSISAAAKRFCYPSAA